MRGAGPDFFCGFRPRIVGFTDRHGTRWKIAAIPLGGYVKFFGDENAASVPDQASIENMSAQERRESFYHQPVGQRAAIVAAGPIANFILAIVIFAFVFALYGRQTTTARIDAVQPESAAAAAGLKPGDIVLAIDGRKIDSFSDMQRIVSASAGRTLAFQIDRGGAPMTINATPALRQGKDGFGNDTCHAVLGVSRSMSAADVKTEQFNPLEAVWQGTKETWFIVERTFSYIGGLFSGTRMRRPARRPDPDRADFGAGGDAGLHAGAAPGGHAFGVDRPPEPVSGPASRWRSPYVLRGRGGPGPAAVGPGPGDRVPHRLRDRRDVDDFYNL